MTATCYRMYALDFVRDGELICTEVICAASPEDALREVEEQGLVPPMRYEVSVTEL